MSVTASVFIATSLDGFIARPDGGIDWLEKANALIPSGEDCGYAAFMATIDVLVMGRNTFEQVVNFDPWPYGDKPVVVLSSCPLFGPLAGDVELAVLASKTYDFGFVQISYRVRKEGSP